MKISKELRAACAVNAVVAGSAFISGWEPAAFFSRLGVFSWVGIASAAICLGALMGMICHFINATGAESLPGIYYAKLDERCGDAISIVHGLLMLTMGAVSLTTAGELGALLWDFRHAYIAVSAIVIIFSALLSSRRMRSLSAFGSAAVPMCLLFFAIQALDGRAIAGLSFISSFDPIYDGNLPLAMLMGCLFAALKSAMAGGVAARYSGGLSPRRFALLCGAIFAAYSSLANAALLRAGKDVISLSLPMVALASRMGKIGYYASIIAMLTGCVSMLTCSLGSLREMISPAVPRPVAVLSVSAAVALSSAAGLRPLVDMGYPLFGWLCALCLGALAFFYERRRKTASAPEIYPQKKVNF